MKTHATSRASTVTFKKRDTTDCFAHLLLYRAPSDNNTGHDIKTLNQLTDSCTTPLNLPVSYNLCSWIAKLLLSYVVGGMEAWKEISFKHCAELCQEAVEVDKRSAQFSHSHLCLCSPLWLGLGNSSTSHEVSKFPNLCEVLMVPKRNHNKKKKLFKL